MILATEAHTSAKSSSSSISEADRSRGQGSGRASIYLTTSTPNLQKLELNFSMFSISLGVLPFSQPSTIRLSSSHHHITSHIGCKYNPTGNTALYQKSSEARSKNKSGIWGFGNWDLAFEAFLGVGKGRHNKAEVRDHRIVRLHFYLLGFSFLFFCFCGVCFELVVLHCIARDVWRLFDCGFVRLG